MNTHKRSQGGFTVIELVLVIVVLCILGALVAITYNGVRASNRDNERQTDVDVAQSQLETFYVQHDVYPSLAQLNDPTWRTAHMKDLKDDRLQDPQWSAQGNCSKDEKAVFADAPAPDCYSYQISAADGAFCDNGEVKCVKYTLTATLENGQSYVKTSLN